MIVRKTFKLINLKTVINGVLYALMMVAIIAAIAFDITGYEKRVPNPTDVESVYVNLPGEYKQNSSYYGVSGTMFTEDSIEYVTDIHKKIVTKEWEYDDYEFNYDDFGSVTINYKLKNGKTLSRRYYIKASKLYETASYKALKSNLMLKNPLTNLATLDRSKFKVTMFEAETAQGYYDLGEHIDKIDVNKLITKLTADDNHSNEPISSEKPIYYVQMKYTYSVDSDYDQDVMLDFLNSTYGYLYENRIGGNFGKTYTYEAYFSFQFNDDWGLFDGIISQSAESDYMVILARYYEDLFSYAPDGTYCLVKEFPSDFNYKYNPHALTYRDSKLADYLMDTGRATYDMDITYTKDDSSFYAAVYKFNASDNMYKLEKDIYDSVYVLEDFNWSLYDTFMSTVYWR